MQLLLSKSQGASMFGWPIFKLWAKFDLTEEESALIEHYRVREFILSEGNTWRDLYRAIGWALLLTFIVLLVLIQTVSLSYALTFPPLIFAVSTFIIYHQIREQIKVSDVLDGRFFACRSMIRLAAREQAMDKMAIIFCHFLEDMKNWGGKEIIEYDPQNLPTVELIEIHYALS